MPKQNAKSAQPHDILIGGRIRARRMAVGLSQGALGDAVGITFQQIQKYEKGMNRIGSSRMIELARVLQTTPAYFFEGLGGSKTTSGPIEQFMAMPDGSKLAKAFIQIENPAIRALVVEQTRALAALNLKRKRPQ